MKVSYLPEEWLIPSATPIGRGCMVRAEVAVNTVRALALALSDQVNVTVAHKHKKDGSEVDGGCPKCAATSAACALLQAVNL